MTVAEPSPTTDPDDAEPLAHNISIPKDKTKCHFYLTKQARFDMATGRENRPCTPQQASDLIKQSTVARQNNNPITRWNPETNQPEVCLRAKDDRTGTIVFFYVSPDRSVPGNAFEVVRVTKNDPRFTHTIGTPLPDTINSA